MLKIWQNDFLQLYYCRYIHRVSLFEIIRYQRLQQKSYLQDTALVCVKRPCQMANALLFDFIHIDQIHVANDQIHVAVITFVTEMSTDLCSE